MLGYLLSLQFFSSLREIEDCGSEEHISGQLLWGMCWHLHMSINFVKRLERMDVGGCIDQETRREQVSS